jgi:hypothetical protein
MLDLDVLFTRGHRRSVAHNLFLLPVGAGLAFLITPLFYLLIGVVSHLILDLIDWGLNLKPFSANLWGARLLKTEYPESVSRCVERYVRSRLFICELAIVGLAVGVWLGIGGWV